MHILFLTDNFPPETNAPATRTYEHARLWVKQGHEVTIITCAPNFPEGKIFPGYRNAWRHREQMDGVDVIRVKTYIAPNKGTIRRTLDFVSFMVAAFLGGMFVRDVDVVVATSPQFFSAIGGWALAELHHRPFVFELRDIWPEQIAAVGAMRRGEIFHILERLELFLYRKAAAVVAVTNAYRENLIHRGVDGDKIFVVTNGVDFDRTSPLPRDRQVIAEHGLGGRFVVGYIGTMGMSQGLENVIEAAAHISAQGRDDIMFLFVGNGAEREALEARAETLSLKNVLFVPPQPIEKIARYWSICDVALAHLRDLPLFKKVIPSKIFEAMGMGIPVLLVSPDGEASSMVKELGIGVHVAAGDVDGFVRALIGLADDPCLRRRLGESGYNHSRSFNRQTLAEKMLQILEKVAHPRLMKKNAAIEQPNE